MATPEEGIAERRHSSNAQMYCLPFVNSLFEAFKKD